MGVLAFGNEKRICVGFTLLCCHGIIDAPIRMVRKRQCEIKKQTSPPPYGSGLVAFFRLKEREEPVFTASSHHGI